MEKNDTYLTLKNVNYPRHLYALHSSEIIVVPGAMYCLMMASNVFRFRSGTMTKKQRFVPRSTPPNTHWPFL